MEGGRKAGSSNFPSRGSRVLEILFSANVVNLSEYFIVRQFLW